MKLLTLNEVKKMLNVDKATLHRWDKSGKFKALRTQGGHRRYKEKDVKTMMGGELEIDAKMKKDIMTVSFRMASKKEFIEDVVSFFTLVSKEINKQE